MKRAYIIGGILVVGAIVLGVVAFSSSLTPYVTLAEAREHGGTVQIHGYLDRTLGYDSAGHFRFVLVDDKGDTMTVVYEEALPANFAQAEGFVLNGRYDPAAGLFRANKMLVKCPSKYQERGGPAPPTPQVP